MGAPVDDRDDAVGGLFEHSRPERRADDRLMDERLPRAKLTGGVESGDSSRRARSAR